MVLFHVIKKYNHTKDSMSPSLVASFSGHNGPNLDLYLTYDEQNFFPINTNKLFEPLNHNLRDPSIIYYNHSFYVAYTGYNENGTGFTVAKSSNLIDWQQYSIKLPNHYQGAWAPQWFIDNGKVYVSISLTDGSREKDTWGNDIGFFKSYIMTAKNEDLTSFSEPKLISYSRMDNHIDPCIIKDKKTYHIFVKNEHNRKIEHFTSDYLFGKFTYLQTIPFDKDVEGPSIIKKNNKFYLFSDEFMDSSSTLMTTRNLSTWSKPIQVGSTDGVRTQHFDIVKLDSEPISKVEQAITFYRNLRNKQK